MVVILVFLRIIIKGYYFISITCKINIGSEIMFNNNKIGKVLIDDPYPFALIKMFDPDFSEFNEKELLINDNKTKIINNY